MVRPWIAAGTLVALVAIAARPAAGNLPDPTTVLADLGFSADQIRQVRSGSIVKTRIEPSSERELVVAFAFRVKPSPTRADRADAGRPARPDGRRTRASTR